MERKKIIQYCTVLCCIIIEGRRIIKVAELPPAGITEEGEGRQDQGAGCRQAADPPIPPAEAVGPAGHKVEGIVLYVQEVVTRPKILNRTILSNKLM